MSSQNQSAAVHLAENNIRVFPCNANKTPRVKGWQDALIRPGWQIAGVWSSHPDAMPAIPVGAHGWLVIDCDKKQNGPDGVAAFYSLCANLGVDLAGAFVVQTPSGGLHYYFRTGTPYGNSSGSLPAGIDVRGVGGYVIAPGAVLPDGRSYRLVQGSFSAISPLPDALAALLKPRSEPAIREVIQPAPEPQNVSGRDLANGKAALQDAYEKIRNAPKGTRNETLNIQLVGLFGLLANGSIQDEQPIIDMVKAAVTENGYAQEDGWDAVWNTYNSAKHKGMSKHRELLGDIEILPWLPEFLNEQVDKYKAAQQRKKESEGQKRKVNVMAFSEIKEKSIEWLWRGYLPLGKLALFAGAGGTGKSTIAFNFAATISNGGFWPDGSRCMALGNVLIWSSEDDPADTIKPRLIAAGADMKRCLIIKGTTDGNGQRLPFDAARDMSMLREIATEIGGVSLFIIDPIVVAVTGDMNKANDVRRDLQGIVDFASDTNCCVLGISHFAKATTGRNAAERVIGSQAFSAFARIVLVAAKDEESQRRVFTRAKSNNSIDTGGFSYAIEAGTLQGGIESTRIRWGESLEGSSRDILASVESDQDGETSKLSLAKRYLAESLTYGPRSSKEMFDEAKERFGISVDTMRRAQRSLGIDAVKDGYSAGWKWALPLTEAINRAKRTA